jgi:hypothetical protein
LKYLKYIYWIYNYVGYYYMLLSLEISIIYQIPDYKQNLYKELLSWKRGIIIKKTNQRYGTWPNM